MINGKLQDDGVPDTADAGPTSTEAGVYTPLLKEYVSGERIFSTTPSATNNPTFSIGVSRGETYEFYANGDGELINRSGSMPLTWSLQPYGSLQIDLQLETDDSSMSFPRVSGLADLGLATQEAVDAFIVTASDIQIEIDIVTIAQTHYFIDEVNPFRLWTDTISEVRIVNDFDRELLTGSANSQPVLNQFEEGRLYRNLNELTLGIIDVDITTPFGATDMLLRGVVDQFQQPGRHFYSHIVHFETKGTGTLTSTGTPIEWFLPLPLP